MISKEELAKIARQTGLHLYQQEKDYLLKLFLYFYYRHHHDAIFKGGTCLKYLLGLERFSEDLDFNIRDPATFKDQIRRTLQDFQDVGINSYFLKEELFPEAYTCEIGFTGPLSAGTHRTQNKFRIDAGYRLGTRQKPEWKIINSEYPETGENFLVLVMSLPEMMVEKIIALTQRKKGRDLYDLWFLIQAGVKLDRPLLFKKARRKEFSVDLRQIVSRQEYERDLTKLTNKMVPYEQISKEIVKLLEYKG